jgi:hypothetical protein
LVIAPVAVASWFGDASRASLDFGPVMIVCIVVALVTLAGGMLMLPPLVAALVRLVRALLAHRLGVVGRLAGDQLERHRQRTLLTAGTLAIGVAMLILLSGTIGAMDNMAKGLVFGLMQERLGILAYSTDESFESANLMSLQRQKEWPRGILAMFDSLHERAYIYGLGFTDPIKEMEGSPLGGVLTLDSLADFLSVGSFRYDESDLETALRIIKRGRAIRHAVGGARQSESDDELVLYNGRRVGFPARRWVIRWAPVVARGCRDVSGRPSPRLLYHARR